MQTVYVERKAQIRWALVIITPYKANPKYHWEIMQATEFCHDAPHASE